MAFPLLKSWRIMLSQVFLKSMTDKGHIPKHSMNIDELTHYNKAQSIQNLTMWHSGNLSSVVNLKSYHQNVYLNKYFQTFLTLMWTSSKWEGKNGRNNIFVSYHILIFCLLSQKKKICGQFLLNAISLLLFYQ